MDTTTAETIKLVKDVLALCGGDDCQFMNWALNYKGSAKGALAVAWRAEGFGDGILSALGINLVDSPPVAELSAGYLLARAKEECARAAASKSPERKRRHLDDGRRMLGFAIAKKAAQGRATKVPSASAKGAIKLLPRG